MTTIISFLYRIVNYLAYETRFTGAAKMLRRFADFLDCIDIYGVKYTALSLIWNLLHSLDYAEGYSGETAPYCGHHYSGFENKYLQESYHEGDGGGATKFKVFGYRLCYENVEQERYYLTKA